MKKKKKKKKKIIAEMVFGLFNFFWKNSFWKNSLKPIMKQIQELLHIQNMKKSMTASELAKKAG